MVNKNVRAQEGSKPRRITRQFQQAFWKNPCNSTDDIISPASIMHGAAAVTSHSFPFIWTALSQQSSAVKPGMVEHPEPPHCPQPAAQQLFFDWMPTIPLLHIGSTCRFRPACGDNTRAVEFQFIYRTKAKGLPPKIRDFWCWRFWYMVRMFKYLFHGETNFANNIPGSLHGTRCPDLVSLGTRQSPHVQIDQNRTSVQVQLLTRHISLASVWILQMTQNMRAIPPCVVIPTVK